MCIAIYKPEGIKIDRKILERCYNANPDGAGFMYNENKELHMHKGFFSFKDFYKDYKQHESKQAVIHFRIKTHGPISTDNCHPFMVNKSLGFVHNGVISGFGEGDMSDTRHFNEEIVKPLAAKWGNLSLFQPAIKSLIESRIGYSKLIFLDRHGNYDIFNENKGVWDNGVWYSNSSYKPYEPPVTKSFQSWADSKYSGYSQGNKITPITKKKTIAMGDLVELDINHYDIEAKKLYMKGELLEVVAVNMDYTVDLMTTEGDEASFVYNVPFAKLTLVEDHVSDESVEDDIEDFYNTPYYGIGFQSKFTGD